MCTQNQFTVQMFMKPVYTFFTISFCYYEKWGLMGPEEPTIFQHSLPDYTEQEPLSAFQNIFKNYPELDLRYYSMVLQ